MNTEFFARMSHGDYPGFRELAGDFFKELRGQTPVWRTMMELGNYNDLRDELHRCKGTAALFGLERVVELLDTVRTTDALKRVKFDLDVLEAELRVAEEALAGMDAAGQS